MKERPDSVRIVAITPNPAIDRTLTLSAPLTPAQLHRVRGVREAAGGKGMNLARAVRALDGLMDQYATGVTSPDDPAVVRRLQSKLLQDLPIGRTEVERIVQEAIETYLTERRSHRPEWRESTRNRILTLLRGL